MRSWVQTQPGSRRTDGLVTRRWMTKSSQAHAPHQRASERTDVSSWTSARRRKHWTAAWGSSARRTADWRACVSEQPKRKQQWNENTSQINFAFGIRIQECLWLDRSKPDNTTGMEGIPLWPWGGRMPSFTYLNQKKRISHFLQHDRRCRLHVPQRPAGTIRTAWGEATAANNGKPDTSDPNPCSQWPSAPEHWNEGISHQLTLFDGALQQLNGLLGLGFFEKAFLEFCLGLKWRENSSGGRNGCTQHIRKDLRVNQQKVDGERTTN